MAGRVLDRVLAAWLWEYALTVGAVDYIPAQGLERILPDHQWFWDGVEHVDPAKEAKAQELRLKNLTTTLAHEYARQGKDWEAELRQRAREKALIGELDLGESAALPAGRGSDAAAG